MKKAIRTTSLAVLAAAAAGALAALFVRDQIIRHRRDLFSQRAVRRLAAPRHMAGEHATVDNINLLRDFISWEPRRLLRNHARAIVQRMEREVRGPDVISNGGAGARTA